MTKKAFFLQVQNKLNKAFLPFKPPIAQGKMVRAQLCFFWSKVFKIKPSKAVLYALIAEGIHLASLIVDDILDGHKERRGKPTLAFLMGEKKSINFSFLLLSFILKKSQKLSFLQRRVIDHTLKQMALGELKNEELKTHAYQKICNHKTASLFCLTGLLPVLENQNNKKHLYITTRFLKSLGKIYQYQDDLKDKDTPLSLREIENLLKKEQKKLEENLNCLVFLNLKQKKWLLKALKKWNLLSFQIKKTK